MHDDVHGRKGKKVRHEVCDDREVFENIKLLLKPGVNRKQCRRGLQYQNDENPLHRDVKARDLSENLRKIPFMRGDAKDLRNRKLPAHKAPDAPEAHQSHHDFSNLRRKKRGKHKPKRGR